MKRGNARSSDPWPRTSSLGRGGKWGESDGRSTSHEGEFRRRHLEEKNGPAGHSFFAAPRRSWLDRAVAPRLTHPRAARGTAPPGPRARPSRRHPARARPRAPRTRVTPPASAPRDPPTPGGPRAFSCISPGGVCLRATRVVRARRPAPRPALSPRRPRRRVQFRPTSPPTRRTRRTRRATMTPESWRVARARRATSSTPSRSTSSATRSGSPPPGWCTSATPSSPGYASGGRPAPPRPGHPRDACVDDIIVPDDALRARDPRPRSESAPRSSTARRAPSCPAPRCERQYAAARRRQREKGRGVRPARGGEGRRRRRLLARRRRLLSAGCPNDERRAASDSPSARRFRRAKSRESRGVAVAGASDGTARWFSFPPAYALVLFFHLLAFAARVGPGRLRDGVPIAENQASARDACALSVSPLRAVRKRLLLLRSNTPRTRLRARRSPSPREVRRVVRLLRLRVRARGVHRSTRVLRFFRRLSPRPSRRSWSVWILWFGRYAPAAGAAARRGVSGRALRRRVRCFGRDGGGGARGGERGTLRRRREEKTSTDDDRGRRLWCALRARRNFTEQRRPVLASGRGVEARCRALLFVLHVEELRRSSSRSRSRSRRSRRRAAARVDARRRVVKRLAIVLA